MTTFEDYSYVIHENKTIGIVRYNGRDEKPVIPQSIKGLPVTMIAKHAFMFTDITEIDIPEGIEAIDTEAFGGCENLQRVSLPSTLKDLGRGVFKGSEQLREVVFPNGNEQYRVHEGIMHKISERTLVFCPPGLKMKAVEVPYGTEVIAEAAFYQNSCLEYVALPDTLKKIESAAFLYTNSLPIIELPPYLEEIEQDAFLVGSGPAAEKRFEIYAFPNSAGYRYAEEYNIKVNPLYFVLRD